MRDPARIDPILAKLGELWHQNPDLRLTQLLVAVTATGERMPNFFYTEDDKVDRSIQNSLDNGLGKHPEG